MGAGALRDDRMPDGRAAINRYATAISEGRDAGRRLPRRVRRDTGRVRQTAAHLRAPVPVQRHARRIQEPNRRGDSGIREDDDGPAKPARGWATCSAGCSARAKQRRVSTPPPRVRPDSPIVLTALGLQQITEERVADGLASLRRAAGMAPDDFFVQFVAGVWPPLRVDAGRPHDARRRHRVVAAPPRHQSELGGCLRLAGMRARSRRTGSPRRARPSIAPSSSRRAESST